jgi:hypothetical protein
MWTNHGFNGMRKRLSSVAMVLGFAAMVAGCPSEPVTVNGDAVSGTGTVGFNNFEGGFWAILGDDHKTYDPLGSLPDEFKQENLAVRFTGRLRRDMGSVHMAGDIIELTSIQRR